MSAATQTDTTRTAWSSLVAARGPGSERRRRGEDGSPTPQHLDLQHHPQLETKVSASGVFRAIYNFLHRDDVC